MTAAVEFGRRAGELRRDERACTLWRTVYADLSAGRVGLLGSVTARAEAQVVRLAALYALLDRSRYIANEHLRAALALWNYCDRSARWIFGDAIGDPIADQIMSSLRAAGDAGMSRTEVNHLFGRNQPAHRITHALTALAQSGTIEREKTRGTGRPVEIFRTTK